MLYASWRWRQEYPSKTALPARICSQMPGSETTESGLAGANEPNLGNFMVSKRQGYGLSHTLECSERAPSALTRSCCTRKRPDATRSNTSPTIAGGGFRSGPRPTWPPGRGIFIELGQLAHL